ncbi:MAG TPA: prepilin-type N-terminal cleavage/methylation domain-containing protein [Planctomycetota bacterium]|nr:prepilin-type N-terminal cleavage/methylation domain-containing protein [Planctomycetota bacterium]
MRRSGFTLIELAVAAGVLSLAIVSTADLVSTTGDTLARGASMATLDAKANALLARIERELVQAGRDTLLPASPAGDASLSYRQAFGYEDGFVQWGSPLRIEFRPDEAQDGLDNDADRFVDEGRIVLVRNAGTAAETEVPWEGGIRSYLEGEVPNGLDDNGNGLVDERGLCFALDGESIVIRLSVEGRDSKGRVLVRTVTTAVRPRN